MFRRAWVAVGFAVLGGLVSPAAFQARPATGAAEAEAELPGECPPVMPVAEVRRGMTGTGLTVTHGRDPERFGVEVLGVLRDGVGPGRDIIVVNTSGSAIDAAGGIWFGMSGSPVYLPDPVTGQYELVGAVAYGFTGGSSPLGGLTPAEDMVSLLDPGAAALATSGPAKVKLPPALARRAAQTVGASVEEVGNTLERLKTPLSVGGVTDRGLRRVRRAVERQGLPLLPYVGSSASVGGGSSRTPRAGESFAAALSLGDITAAGIGTTTLVCYGQAVAFGHPFLWSGKTTLSARAATTLAIVADPLFGSFKLANVAGNLGVVKNDRLAGIRANIGPPPTQIPITSLVRNLDDGTAKSGQTAVILRPALPFVSFLHLLTSIDVTFDQIGPGSSELQWTIRGLRASGAGFVIRRGNRYASLFDVSFESVNDLATDLDLITSNGLENVRITSVAVTRADVERKVKLYSLTDVLVSRDGVTYRDLDLVRARPGDTIFLRALLRPHGSTSLQSVDLSVTVPATAREGGTIEVGAALSGGGLPCLIDDGECGEEAAVDSFDDLLAIIRRQPRNDVLGARLRTGESGVQSEDSEALDRVVSGQRSIELELRDVPGAG